MTEQEFIDQDNIKFAAAKRLEYNMVEMFKQCKDNARADGLVLEFGVYAGSTIRIIERTFDDANQIYGFDSWLGLPEDTVEKSYGFNEGAFKIDKIVLSGLEDRITLVDGWFIDTLPGFMDTHPGPVRFMNIDCDQYISTKHVFDAMESRITTGTVINFDEYKAFNGWENREYRAFRELMLRINYDYDYLYSAVDEQQVAVVIKNKL